MSGKTVGVMATSALFGGLLAVTAPCTARAVHTLSLKVNTTVDAHDVVP